MSNLIELPFLSVSGFGWLTAMTVAVVKTVAVIAVVLLLLRLRPRLSSSTRHLILFHGVAAALLVPLFSLLLPAWKTVPRPTALDSVRWIEPAAPTTPSLDPVTVPATTVGEEQTAVGSAPVTRAPRFPSSPSGVTSSPESTWLAGAVTLWALGVLFLLLRTTVGTIRVRQIVKESRPLDDEEWTALLSRSTERIGLRAAPRLLVYPGPIMPMTWGIRRPVILLPADAESWPEETRRTIILHELAHVRRRDLLFEPVVRVASMLQWFNPMIWTAKRNLAIEREKACDDLAISGGVQPGAYANSLLEIAVSFGSVSPAPTCMARPSDLESRVLSILDSTRSRRQVSGSVGAMVLVVALGILVPLSVVGFSDLEASPLEPSASKQVSPQVEAEADRLVEALLSKDPSIHDAAEDELERRNREPELMNRLAERLFEEYESDSEVFEKYSDLQLESGPISVEQLIALLSDDSAINRAAAARALGEMEATEAVDPLVRTLYDESPHVREWAARALGEIADPRAVDGLLDRLRDESSDVREWAVRGLGEIGDDRAVDGLLPLVADSSPEVREWTARSLAEIGDPRAGHSLVTLLDDPSEDVREWAIRGLAELDYELSVPRIIDLLDDRSPDVREWSVRALGDMAAPSAVEPLIGMLGDSSPEVREWAIRSLATIGDRRAIEPIMKRLDDPSPDVREWAMRAAAELGSR